MNVDENPLPPYDPAYMLTYSRMTCTEKIIVEWIKEKFDGTNEAAARCGVYLDEWPEQHDSDIVRRFEEKYGPLQGLITPTERMILDLIWKRAEGTGRRQRFPHLLLTPEEEDEFFGPATKS